MVALRRNPGHTAGNLENRLMRRVAAPASTLPTDDRGGNEKARI